MIRISFKIFYLYLFLLGKQTLLYGQITDIYRDTTIVIPTSIELGESKYSVYDFITIMEDGKYRFFNTDNPDSKNIEEQLRIEGEFFDGKKNGVFKYYGSTVDVKKHKLYKSLFVLVSYQEGELHGQFITYLTPEIKISQGYYNKGKKEGFFINYNQYKRDGTVKEIYVFSNDELIAKTIYNHDGTIKEQFAIDK